MRNYDFKKIKDFIVKHANIIQSASLGMNEDWFWTAETIYQENQFCVDLDDENLLIGGIKGSYWATPTLEVTYFDGESERIEASNGDCDLDDLSRIEKTINFQSELGCLSQPLQENIGGIDRKI